MPAPGATCSDCILAKQRQRQADDVRPVRLCAGGCGKTVTETGQRCVDCELKARTSAAAAPDDPGLWRAKSPEEAEARDRAMLDRLKTGPAGFDALVAVMPGDFVSGTAREMATRSTLIRLKTKQRVKIVPDGYAVA